MSLVDYSQKPKKPFIFYVIIAITIFLIALAIYYLPPKINQLFNQLANFSWHYEFSTQTPKISSKFEVKYTSAHQSGWQSSGITEKNIRNARMEYDPESNEPMIAIELDASGKEKLRQITSRYKDYNLGIFIDSQLIVEQKITETDNSGKVIVQDGLTQENALALLKKIQSYSAEAAKINN